MTTDKALEAARTDDTIHLAKSVDAWGDGQGMGTAYWFEVSKRLARALLERVAPMRDAMKSALGCLDDPTGGQHVADMRQAASILRAALSQKETPT